MNITLKDVAYQLQSPKFISWSGKQENFRIDILYEIYPYQQLLGSLNDTTCRVAFGEFFAFGKLQFIKNANPIGISDYKQSIRDQQCIMGVLEVPSTSICAAIVDCFFITKEEFEAAT